METTVGVRLAVKRDPKRVGGAQVEVERLVRAWDRHLHQTLEVPAGQTVQVPTPALGSIGLVYIEADAPLRVRTGASDGEAQALVPPETGATAPYLRVGPASGLWLENEGATAVQVVVLLAGTE